MSCLALRRCHWHPVVAESLCDGLSLSGVANLRRGGMSIDVTDIAGIHAGTLQAKLQGASRTGHVRCRNMVTVAREAPAYDFCKDGSPTTLCVLQALHDKRCTAAAGHQSVAVAVKGTAGLLRSIHSGREGLQGIEGSNAVHVILLGTATDDAVLQSVADEQESQSERL